MLKSPIVAGALVLLAVPVAAQNLLTNGTFDTGLSGWETWDDRAAWRGDVGNTITGGSGPGAVEIRQEGADCNGGRAMIQQRVAVTPGTMMMARVAAYLPGGGNEAPGAGGFVYWEDSSYNVIASNDLTAASPGTDRWFWLEVTAPVPAGVAYAAVTFGVDTPGGGCTTGAWAIFDDAWFSRTAPELFVPAAAAAGGVGGTYWSTTLWAVNPNDVEVRLEGSFLPSGQDNSPALAGLQTLATIPARGTAEIRDVVSVLGASGAGGLYLRAFDVATGDGPAQGLGVVTYTFTPDPSGEGNYGQAIPAEPGGDREVAHCPGVRHDDVYRTNVGVLNTSGDEITVRIEVRAGDGTVAGSASWTLPPYGHRQKSVDTVGVSSLAAGTVEVRRTAGTGGFLAYISRVDNDTGDAVYVLGR